MYLLCFKKYVHANIIVASKTATAHPRLEGTIYSAAADFEEAGGQALPQIVDVRDESSVENAVNEGVKKFGGIDFLINNASAIHLANTSNMPMKKYYLIQAVNVRGTFLCSKLCLPHLKKSDTPHILNMSPPLSYDAKWFQNHGAYTISKFGMSMCALGMAAEFKPFNIKVNSLWPKTAIATAAVKYAIGGDNILKGSRTPEIMADAAILILQGEETGQFYIDEDYLRTKGIEDFDGYAAYPGEPLFKDLYVD